MRRLIDFRFILTPFATTVFDTPYGVRRKYFYLFGLKIADIALYKNK